MTRPYSVCGPGIFKKIIEAGDEFLSRKKIKGLAFQTRF